jgi:hypothetical protein
VLRLADRLGATCSGSTPVQLAGLVLLFLLTAVLYLCGAVSPIMLKKGDNMKRKKTSLKSQPTKLRYMLAAVTMTMHSILASFLGGSPMLA